MHFNTEFMSIYEELLTLQESSIATITKPNTNITDLQNLVTKYRDVLNTACQGVTASKGVGIFLAPDETRPHYTKAIAKVQTAADRENRIDWRYGPLGPMPGHRNHISDLLNNVDEQINFNLDSCWVGFFVVGKNKISTLADPLIAALTDYTPELQWNDEVLLTKPGSLFGGVNNNNVFGICVKYSSIANISTLTSFVDPISAVDMAQAIINTGADVATSSDTSKVSIEDLFDKAVDFTVNFVNTGYRAVSKLPELTKESIKTENDLLDIAFYVEDLITYYHSGNENQRNNMLALLNIFEVKLCGTGDDDDYESVQYLGSSGRQERILAKDLVRNTAATKTPYESDEEEKYHYLVSKKFVTGRPDFIYNESKIDAKIYRDESQMRKLMTKKAHGADFLIVYLKYPKEGVHWRALATHEIKDFATAKKLKNLMADLNEQGSIVLVERTDFK